MTRCNPLIGFVWLLFLNACTPRWAPTLERVKQECGEDIATETSGRKFLKVLTPLGAELDNSSIYDLKASLRNGSSAQDLAISSRGCVAVSRVEGQVELQVLKRNWAAVESVDSGLFAASFTRVTLRETEPLKFRMECPDEGYWAANRSLKLPLRFESGSDPALFEIEVRAVDELGHETRLYSKALGEKSWKTDEALDLSQLDEKMYTLVAWQKDLSRQTALTASHGCPLAILRHQPVVDGLRQQGPMIVKQGEILPWSLNQENARLHVCREPVASDAAADSCEATSICRETSAFRTENLVKAEKAGLWKYFVYADDSAQNTSATSCQVVIVTDSHPTLQLNWRDPVLNAEKEPLLKQPEPILTLDIAAFHQTVPSAILHENLECRAELLVKGLGNHPGKEVRCLSGACKNLRLDSFQPCSPELEISISDVLAEANLLDARLRITARVHDGAGREAEQSRDIWLRKSFWGMQQLQPPQWSEDDLPHFNQILDLNEGRVLASSHGRTFIHENESWQEIPPPFTEAIERVNFVKMPDGTVVARFHLEADEDRLATYQNKTWQLFTLADWPQRQDCHTLSLAESGDLICTGTGSVIAFNLQKVLDAVPYQEIVDGRGCFHPTYSESSVRNAAGTWYIPCELGLLTKAPGGELENVDFPASVGSVVTESREFDLQGRLWVVLHTLSGRPIHIGYIEGAKFTEVPTPIALEPGYSSLSLARNERGAIQFQGFVWSETDQAWQDVEAIRRIFPSGAISVKRLASGGLIYENGSQILLDQKGRQSFIPKRGLGLFKYETADNAILGTDGNTWLSYPPRGLENNVIKLKSSNFLAWGASALNLPRESIHYFSRPSTLRLVSSGFYSFRDGRWDQLAPNPDFLCTRTFIEDEKLWCGGNYSLIQWNTAAQTWDTVWQDDEEGTFSSYWFQGQTQTSWRDGTGRLWFVKYDGSVITEKDGTWTAMSAIAPLAGEDAWENVEAVDVVDGRFMMATTQALYWADGTRFSRQPLTDFGLQEPISFLTTLGYGFLLVHFEDESLPAQIIDTRRAQSGRKLDLTQVVGADEFIRKTLQDAQGRLIVVTDARILIETGPDQWTTVITAQAMRNRLGDPDLSWDREVWIEGPNSLWLTVSSSRAADVLQVFLP